MQVNAVCPNINNYILKINYRKTESSRNASLVALCSRKCSSSKLSIRGNLKLVTKIQNIWRQQSICGKCKENQLIKS